jgi:hypothetical protein
VHRGPWCLLGKRRGCLELPVRSAVQWALWAPLRSRLAGCIQMQACHQSRAYHQSPSCVCSMPFVFSKFLQLQFFTLIKSVKCGLVTKFISKPF